MQRRAIVWMLAMAAVLGGSVFMAGAQPGKGDRWTPPPFKRCYNGDSHLVQCRIVRSAQFGCRHRRPKKRH